MFFKRFDAWELEGTKAVTTKCQNCGNTGEHFVFVQPQGPQLGLIWAKKPFVGLRKYFLVCRTCGFPEKELSKAQAQAMRSE